MRLRRAGELLALRAPLSTVALEAGFSDQAHFCRQFHQATGVTPGRWRKPFA
ncbi:MAG: helix-turn-helix domain-containing protein [Longimicrobiales bacterium]